MDSNSMELYFKDKIDWKFFNFLIDKLTEYDDMGILTDVSVCIRFSFHKYKRIYHKMEAFDDNSKYIYYNSGELLDLCKQACKSDGLFYRISMRDCDDSITLVDDINKFYDKVKFKCRRYDKLLFKVLFVKPNKIKAK